MNFSISEKYVLIFLITVLLFFSGSIKACGFSGSLSDSSTLATDTLSIALTDKSKEELKKEKKEKRWQELKDSHNRLFIHGAYVFAKLDTKVTFNHPESIFKISLSLEDHLGLPASSSFFSGSAIYRITPSSGIYVNYYGFNRNKFHSLGKDIIWGEDTIHAGTISEVYFKTQVFSAGYLLSILKKPDSFLGTYINFYIMPISLGIKSDYKNTNHNLSVIAPLPNIGMIAMFKLTKWLSVYSSMGFFSLYTRYLGGYIQDLNISFPIRITHWLGVSVNYQRLFVHAIFPNQAIETFVDYDFKGPAVGVTIKL